MLLFTHHLHLAEDFVVLGVIIGTKKEKTDVILQLCVVKGCRWGGGGRMIMMFMDALEPRLNNPGLSQTLHHGADYSTLLVGLRVGAGRERRGSGRCLWNVTLKLAQKTAQDCCRHHFMGQTISLCCSVLEKQHLPFPM